MDIGIVPIPEGSAPRDTDILHEVVQGHISRCDKCRRAIANGPVKKFGDRTGMCDKYVEIVQMFADAVAL